jgi:hypothetical protein
MCVCGRVDVFKSAQPSYYTKITKYCNRNENLDMYLD